MQEREEGLTRAVSLTSKGITSSIEVGKLDFDMVSESSNTVEGTDSGKWVSMVLQVHF